MRILLTGGTGLIGRHLCHLWRAQGHEVWVWSRRPQAVPAICGAGVQGVAELVELDDQPLDAVVNLAGAPIADRPWTAARRQELWDSRVTLTEQLVDWLARRAQRPAVLVSGSATGWYGDAGEQRLDETSPPADQGFAARLCGAWEDAACRAEALGLRVVRVRTAPVLTLDGGMLPRLLPLYRLGLGGPQGSGRQWMPWIHLHDEIALIDFLVSHPDASGPYNACAPQAVRNRDFAHALGRALQRPTLLRVPAFALKGLGELSSLLLGGQHLTPRRLQEQGFAFRFADLDLALADLLGRHR
ncbi:TIGR01777 family oxidoreductase [Pseudomonas flexibilis]|uniref:NAD-dependent dehydratase n=1 Tax=Pseudomonas flexibilis TaxID=706570 RepID=A0A0B3BU99_9PSED|nr:TIGR01777 family oxidoreductase [Pseudomonas flexibilis]KHO66210.1 NAD-dependent dehydratase [Pseudomonas flexibilis]SCY46108.1 hypothetical protein SAMN02927929_02880 [Pseudomonas flexibilis]